MKEKLNLPIGLSNFLNNENIVKVVTIAAIYLTFNKILDKNAMLNIYADKTNKKYLFSCQPK